MRLNKKGFTLIELLVVITLIGIVSLVAIPNVREFIINKEYKNDVFKIASIINKLKSDLDSGKTDPATFLAYEMAGVYITSDATSGLTLDTRMMDRNKFATYKNQECTNKDDTNYWNSSSFKKYNFQLDASVVSNSNENFKNLRIGGPYQYACFASDQLSFGRYSSYFDRNNALGICHQTKIVANAAKCSASATNDPYYGITVNKLGRAAIVKWNYTTSTWNEEKN